MLHQTYLIALLALANAAPPPDLAPVTDKTFNDVVIKPHKGQAVLVSFWASYCIPCLGELPKLIEMKKDMQKKGGDVVLINVDAPGHNDQIKKILAQKGIAAFPSYQVSNEDPQPFIDLIDKKWMGEVPFAVVYGKDGTQKQTLSGEQKPETLQAALVAALQ